MAKQIKKQGGVSAGVVILLVLVFLLMAAGIWLVFQGNQTHPETTLSSETPVEATNQGVTTTTSLSAITTTQSGAESLVNVEPDTTTQGSQTSTTVTTLSTTTTTTTEQLTTETTKQSVEVQVIDGISYIEGLIIVNKSYSLPEDYNPGGMTAETKEAFSELQKAAYAEKGFNLYSVSDFRSYAFQKTLYQNYCNRDGQEKADRFSARAGHSEHQTGLAIDVNYAGDAFKNTPEAAWLAENSWKYGFIIRYPEGKEDITGYKYEPWHIRFVGKDWAKKIYDSGLTVEEYFGITSQYAE